MQAVDLDRMCRHCGRTLRRHCTGCRCRLHLRWCEGMLRHTHPEVFAELADPSGNCRRCGHPVAEHFEQEPALLFGEPRTEVVIYLPSEIKECRPAAASEGDAGGQ